MMQEPMIYPIPSPFGLLEAVMSAGRLVQLSFLGQETLGQEQGASTVAPSDYPPLVAKVYQQVCDYFKRPHQQWLIDLNTSTASNYQLSGTPLYQQIWRHLQAIPVGETRTYGEIAASVGTGPRIVGNACRTNQFALMIPCHRVVASNGLGGYYGRSADGLSIKQHLLDWERRFV